MYEYNYNSEGNVLMAMLLKLKTKIIYYQKTMLCLCNVYKHKGNIPQQFISAIDA